MKKTTTGAKATSLQARNAALEAPLFHGCVSIHVGSGLIKVAHYHSPVWLGLI